MPYLVNPPVFATCPHCGICVDLGTETVASGSIFCSNCGSSSPIPRWKACGSRNAGSPNVGLPLPATWEPDPISEVPYDPTVQLKAKSAALAQRRAQAAATQRRTRRLRAAGEVLKVGAAAAAIWWIFFRRPKELAAASAQTIALSPARAEASPDRSPILSEVRPNVGRAALHRRYR